MVWGQIDRVAVDPKVLARACAWGRGLKLYRLLRRATRRRWRGREVPGGLGQTNAPDAAGVTATARAARLRCWFAFQKGSVFRFSAIRTSPGDLTCSHVLTLPASLVTSLPGGWAQHGRARRGDAPGSARELGLRRAPPPVSLGRRAVQGTWWRGSVRVSPGAVHTSLVLLPEQPLELQLPVEDTNYGGNTHRYTRERKTPVVFSKGSYGMRLRKENTLCLT